MNVETPLIRKEILRDKIFGVLREWILNGTLKPGERIVESTLAARLKVSRAPFREALWLLAHHGLVQIRAHHGASVTRLSGQDIREIFEIRQTLETACAQKIRRSLTPEKTARLKAALKALEEAARAKDLPRFSAADLEFHKAFWQLAENRHVEEILGDISTRFFGYELIRDLPHSQEFRFDAMVDEHRRMVKLTLEGTPAAIEAGFQEAFTAFLDYVLVRFGEAAP